MSVVSLRSELSPPDLLERLPAGPGRFLLESAGGPADIARWSFLGVQPFLRFTARGRRSEIATEEGVTVHHGDPLALLDELLAEHAVPARPDLPPFQGGAVGYFSYDLGRQLESLPATAADDLSVPDISLGFYGTVVAVDHEEEKVWVMGPAAEAWVEAIACGAQAARKAPSACGAQAARKAPSACGAQPPPGACLNAPDPLPAAQLHSNFTREAYLTMVRRALDYICAGDIFQVNVAQRFTATAPAGAWPLYLRLRHANPAPFAAYLDCGTFAIASASPERFLRLADGRVETRPIKGTRPRGATAAQDAASAAALLDSAKERAELSMIVDLERNDLGRICQVGSIQVPDHRRVEAYPTVFHTVSTVTGVLNPGTTPGDLLRAVFPGGSVTGAPKIRAMAIIEELEGLRRGPYCGALGYVGFTGAIDLSVVIRTLVIKDGTAYFHAGGGIVADSDPAAEYDETLTKAGALISALGLTPPT